MKPLSLAQMILGLLVDGPAHGYELRRCLAPFFGAGVALNAGLLYPALARLEAQGLVTKRSVRQERLPAKHVYTISAAGKREILGWLARSETEDRPVRYDFFHRDPLLARVMFFRHLPRERVQAILRDQAKQAEARCEDYARVRAGMLARQADPYRLRILEFGLRYHRLRRAWILDLLKNAESGLSRAPSARRPARQAARRSARGG
jgi:DNA-binding PadR family transcriptional regulator